MDTLKLNPKQIQVAIDQLTAQPEGVNKLMEIALNGLMKAEREVYLDAAQSGNKANGYRAIDTAIQKCVLHLKRSILRKTKKQHRSVIADELAYIFQLDNKEDTKKVLYSRALAVS